MLGMTSAALRQDARELYALSIARTRATIPAATRPDPNILGQTILEYVQSGGYRPDPPGEWYQGPEWTREYAGNCNDLAVMFATLANLCGLPAEVWWLKQDALGASLDHVTVGVRLNSAQVCWAESTVPGARYCESPYRALQRTRAGARVANHFGL